jgi:hypothetical protein
MIEWDADGMEMGRRRGRGGENRYLIFKSYSFL